MTLVVQVDAFRGNIRADQQADLSLSVAEVLDNVLLSTSLIPPWSADWSGSELGTRPGASIWMGGSISVRKNASRPRTISETPSQTSW